MKMSELRKLMQLASGGDVVQAQQQMAEHLLGLGIAFHQVYHELEMTSPYVDSHRDITYSNTHINLHSHDFFELLFCRSCEDVEYLVGADRYQLQPGDIILIPPGLSHRPLLPEQNAKPYDRYVIWLSREFMAMYAGFFSDSAWKNPNEVTMLRTSGAKQGHLGDMFRAGVLLAEQQEFGWEASLIGNTILLLTQIRQMGRDHSAGGMQAETPQLLDLITTYVESHYTRPLAIADLAGEFFVSSSTISHLFKQKMGVSFYRYVTQRRLIAAKTLIQEGLSLEDVSRNVGFSDYSTFFRAFKQEYGISPRQYRELQSSPAR